MTENIQQKPADLISKLHSTTLKMAEKAVNPWTGADGYLKPLESESLFFIVSLSVSPTASHLCPFSKGLWSCLTEGLRHEHELCLKRGADGKAVGTPSPKSTPMVHVPILNVNE